MTPRMNFAAASPDAYKAVSGVSAYVHKSLEAGLLHLIETRASQINGCAFCLHMHTADARKAGESEERLYVLNAWRESPLFTPRERAALAWTEALTRIADRPPTDAEFAAAREQFSEKELMDLSVAIGTINTWNRLAISFRAIHPVKDAPAG